jgi:hypothetical protein
VVLIAFHGTLAGILRVSPFDNVEEQGKFLNVALGIINQTEETMRQFAS